MATTRFIDHLLEGDHASRPAAGDVPEGTLYSCTDHALIYQSDTSTWSTWATLGAGTPDLDAVLAASGGQDIADALTGAAAPDAGNVFATMADITGGSSPILAVLRYAPGSDTTIATTTSATQSDIDATNAIITATVPASGSVMIRVACAMTAGGSNNAFLGIRQGSTNLIGPILVSSNAGLVMGQRWFRLTGLTPGSQSFKAAFSIAGGGTFTLYGGPTYGPIEMDVWAL